VPALLELPRLLNAAVRLERDEASEEELRALLRGGSSLGGARPKAHVLDADGKVAIAKLPSASSDEWDVMRWEAVALRLAHAGDRRRDRASLSDGRRGSAWCTAIDFVDPTASVDTLVGVASCFRLSDDDIRLTLGQVVDATSRWRTVAKEAGLGSTAVEYMAPAFEHDQAERARQIVAP
jgi:hypothetical protein